MNKSLLLTPEALALVEIRNRQDNSEVYFSRLKEFFSGEYSPATINKCIKNLEKEGAIICTWKLADSDDNSRNRWIRDIQISDEYNDLVSILESVVSLCQRSQE
jgi:hypothetical protein